MTWLLLAFMALITFMNRYLFLMPGISFVPNDKFKLLLSYSGLSVLTVIWVPFVFTFDEHSGLSVAGYDYLIGSLLALLLTWLRMHTLLVVSISFLGFALVRWII